MDDRGIGRHTHTLVPRGVPQVPWTGVGSVNQLALAPEPVAVVTDTQAHTMARKDGPATSRAAAAAASPRTGSQKALLLEAYLTAGDAGLTDEQAAEATGMLQANPRWDYTKRCSDLRRDGFIAPTGEQRMGAAGHPRDVCAVTVTGFLSVEVAA
jgi:hypothetical protein